MKLFAMLVEKIFARTVAPFTDLPEQKPLVPVISRLNRFSKNERIRKINRLREVMVKYGEH